LYRFLYRSLYRFLYRFVSFFVCRFFDSVGFVFWSGIFLSSFLQRGHPSIHSIQKERLSLSSSLCILYAVWNCISTLPPALFLSLFFFLSLSFSFLSLSFLLFCFALFALLE
jgi:hypothetical protein